MSSISQFGGEKGREGGGGGRGKHGSRMNFRGEKRENRRPQTGRTIQHYSNPKENQDYFNMFFN